MSSGTTDRSYRVNLAMRAVVLLTSVYLLLHNSFGFVHQPLLHSPRLSKSPAVHQSNDALEGPPTISLSSEDDASTQFRRMEEDDVADIVRLYVREYGSSNPQRPFTLFPPLLHRFSFTHFCDNFVLACILYLALYQRLGRKWITEPDHQVWLLLDCEEKVVGAAELSLEAPGRPALPIGLPVEFKKRLFGATQLRPYLSNVIIKESCRGCGYGTLLLQEIEQQAQHHQELNLHVDANATAAKSLYDKLGYTVAGTRSNDLMGRIFRFMAGLYFVPESEQLYMKKDLS